MPESSEYHGSSGKKHKRNQQQESNKSKQKNSTPLPPNPGRRRLLIGGAALGTLAALAGGKAALDAMTQNDAPPPPTKIPESSAESSVDVVKALQALESKYRPGVMPDIEDPEFINDAWKTLDLTYQLCNEAFPELANDTAYAHTEIAFTPNQIKELADKHDPSGGLARAIPPLGGITFGSENRTMLLTMHPDGIATYGRQGINPLAMLRSNAAHEWGHYVTPHKKLPPNQIISIQNTPLPVAVGAQIYSDIPSEVRRYTSVMRGLDEYLVEVESREFQLKKGLIVMPDIAYKPFGDRLDNLYNQVGQNFRAQLPTLFDMRRNSDPIGVINQFAGFVANTEKLNEQDKIKWGTATVDFALAGMNTERDILLHDPEYIRQVASIPTQTTFDVV